MKEEILKNPELTGGEQKKTLSRFKKGISGNPKGRPKGTVSIVTALKRRLEEVKDKSNGEKKTYLEYFIDQVIKKSIEDGDVAMMKDVIDRVDGKPQQFVDLTTNGLSLIEKEEVKERVANLKNKV